MFERYKISDLYIASIDVWYPGEGYAEIDIGGICQINNTGYGYATVLLKDGDNYIDIANPRVNICTERDSGVVSYVVDNAIPMLNFYDEGTVSRKKALKLAEPYYSELRDTQKSGDGTKKLQKIRV